MTRARYLIDPFGQVSVTRIFLRKFRYSDSSLNPVRIRRGTYQRCQRSRVNIVTDSGIYANLELHRHPEAEARRVAHRRPEEAGPLVRLSPGSRITAPAWGVRMAAERGSALRKSGLSPEVTEYGEIAK